MLEIDAQQISEILQQSINAAWEGVGKPLIETFANLFIQVATSDPAGDIIFALTLVSLVIGALGLGFRWAIKQINNPY